MRTPSDVQIHPRGKIAVVTVDWNDIMTDATYSDLYEVALDGSGARALTSGPHHNREARWSPDGERLAYLSDRGGSTRIVVRERGTERVLETGAEAPSRIAWSPDGKWIAYLQFVAETPDWAPELAAKPEGAKWAPAAVAVTKLRWTFDGAGLARPGSTRIFVAPSTGGTPRQVSRPPYFHTSYLFEPELTWAADSKAVIAAAVKGEQEGWGNYQGGELYSFPLEGSPVPLTSINGHEALARVSPDGKWLAWAGFPWKQQGYTVTKLHVQAASGGKARALTGDWDRDVAAPAWSPDSGAIYYLSEDQGSTNLHRVMLKGKREAVTRGERRMASFSIASDGTIAAIESRFETPPQVVVLARSGGEPKAVFDPNAERIRGCKWSAAEEIRVTSFDGHKIQGWIVKPPGFDAAKKYPLLVSIHGGPHGMYGVNFSHEFQMYAGRGYVVLFTNPRGSTGYGEEFGNVIQYRWPGDDIKDILAAADAVIARGYIDPERTVVLGGSGGGLMTTWMVTQTNRFKAAVALYPVTNWFTHIGSNDNGIFVGSVYRKAWGWQNPQDYMERSPVFQVSKVKTPTMLITGEEDWRTPIAQSEEFYRALKIQGIDTVFVRVPGEGHGFRKHPSHRIAAFEHAAAWLERYVGGR